MFQEFEISGPTILRVRDRTVPLDVWRVDGDIEEGISTIFYDFKRSWQGDDPNRGLDSQPDLDQTYFNLITERAEATCPRNPDALQPVSGRSIC